MPRREFRSSANKKLLSPVVCFLDESATDAKDLDHAVIGGMVLNRSDLPEFESDWSAMLNRYSMTNGLHMIDLGPSGRYPHLIGNDCSDMLAEAVRIINHCRIFTFGTVWGNRKHEELFSEEMRSNHISVYALEFMMVVEINRKSAVRSNYAKKIDYVLDDGNRFKKQVLEMHTSIRNLPELAEFQVGQLDFLSDTDVMGLQAADLISWTTRRRKAGKPLVKVHEPLNGIFDDSYADTEAPEAVIREMAVRFVRAEGGSLSN